MTFVIKLSRLGCAASDFDAAVTAYIKAKKDHQNTIGEPAPTAPPMVEAAVRVVPGSIEEERADDYVADYSVEDDSPSLDERKIALANDVTAQANKAIDAVSPPLKRRLWDYQHAEAAKPDPLLRSAEQKAVVEAHEARSDKVQEIYRHLAQMHSDIHDLTDATFDAWKPAPFPG